MTSLLPESSRKSFLVILVMGAMLLYHGQLTFQHRLTPDPGFTAEGHALAGETGGSTDGHAGASDYVAILFEIFVLVFWLFFEGVRKSRGTVAFRRVERRRSTSGPFHPRRPTASFLQVFRL